MEGARVFAVFYNNSLGRSRTTTGYHIRAGNIDPRAENR
jgi:hypothetical protein